MGTIVSFRVIFDPTDRRKSFVVAGHEHHGVAHIDMGEPFDAIIIMHVSQASSLTFLINTGSHFDQPPSDVGSDHCMGLYIPHRNGTRDDQVSSTHPIFKPIRPGRTD